MSSPSLRKTTNILLRIKFYIQKQKVYLCPSKHFFRIHFQSSLEKYPPDQNPSIIRFSGVFILYPAEHPIFSFWSYSINTAMCVSVCVPDLLFLHCALFKNCICFCTVYQETRHSCWWAQLVDLGRRIESTNIINTNMYTFQFH